MIKTRMKVEAPILAISDSQKYYYHPILKGMCMLNSLFILLPPPLTPNNNGRGGTAFQVKLFT